MKRAESKSMVDLGKYIEVTQISPQFVPDKNGNLVLGKVEQRVFVPPVMIVYPGNIYLNLQDEEGLGLTQEQIETLKKEPIEFLFSNYILLNNEDGRQEKKILIEGLELNKNIRDLTDEEKLSILRLSGLSDEDIRLIYNFSETESKSIPEVGKIGTTLAKNLSLFKPDPGTMVDVFQANRERGANNLSDRQIKEIVYKDRRGRQVILNGEKLAIIDAFAHYISRYTSQQRFLLSKGLRVQISLRQFIHEYLEHKNGKVEKEQIDKFCKVIRRISEIDQFLETRDHIYLVPFWSWGGCYVDKKSEVYDIIVQLSFCEPFFDRLDNDFAFLGKSQVKQLYKCKCEIVPVIIEALRASASAHRGKLLDVQKNKKKYKTEEEYQTARREALKYEKQLDSFFTFIEAKYNLDDKRSRSKLKQDATRALTMAIQFGIITEGEVVKSKNGLKLRVYYAPQFWQN